MCATTRIAFGMLKDGKVDAFPTDETVLRAIVQQDGHPDDYRFPAGLHQDRATSASP